VFLPSFSHTSYELTSLPLQHLIYSVVDEVMLVLFPELAKKKRATTGPEVLRPLFLS
jgi:hypothetical protein